MRYTLLLLIFAQVTVLNAQRCLYGMDSTSYVQGFIDVKYKNRDQVYLREKEKIIKTPSIGKSYKYVKEYFTLVTPGGATFLLLFRNYSFAPENITSAEEFSKLYIDEWIVNDSIVTLTPKEKAVLYLALKEVPISEIFVTKEEYFNSYFFQALSVKYIFDDSIKIKNRRGEEPVVAFYNQLGYIIYRVKFRSIYKQKIISEKKLYIKRKLKKNEDVINNL